MPHLTMTVPRTEGEKRYHNRFGGLRKFLNRVTFVPLLIWAAADYFGFTLLILPSFPIVSSILTLILLYVGHKVLLATAKAAGYDIFDGSGKLETGWFLLFPLGITLIMLFGSVLGAEQVIEEYIVHKPKIQSDSTILKGQNEAYSQSYSRFKQDSAQVAAPYAEQIAAIKGKYQLQIVRRENVKTYDKYDVLAKKNAIKNLASQRDAEIGDILKLYATDFKNLADKKRKNDDFLAANFGEKIKNVSDNNRIELAKKAKDEENVNKWAWTFSFAMCGLFWLFTLWGCRIDCKSGIVPVYNHTDGDQHDVLDKLWFVFSDIISSRFNNRLVKYHDENARAYMELRRKDAENPMSGLPPTSTTPPTPPSGGGGNNGGGGGGGSTPVPSVPTPTNALAVAFVTNACEGTYKGADRFDLVLAVDNRPIFSATFVRDEEGYFNPKKEITLIGFAQNRGRKMTSDGVEHEYIDAIKSIMSRRNYLGVIEKIENIKITDIVTPPSVETNAFALLKQERYNSLTDSELKYKITQSPHAPFSHAIWEETLEAIDPQINYWSNGTADIERGDLEKVLQLAAHYSKPKRENEQKTDASAIYAVHEAGHYIAYIALCRQLGFSPSPIRLQIQKDGAANLTEDNYFTHAVLPFAEFPDNCKAQLHLAGFAAECLAERKDPTAFILEKNNSDYRKAKSICPTETSLKLAFLNAYVIITDYAKAHWELSNLLVKDRVLDAKKLKEFETLHMPPTPSVTEQKNELLSPVATDVKPVATLEVVKNETDTTLITDALKKKISSLNSECSHYENKNGTLDTIIKRIAEKRIELYKNFETYTVLINDDLRQNWVKVDNRAYNILTAHKAGKEVGDK